MLVIAGSIISCNNGSQEPSTASPPEPALEAQPAERAATLTPDVTLPTLAGDSLALSDLRGRYVLVNFWATWCPPCRAETPDLVALHHRFSDRDLTLVGISVDLEGPHVVQAFVDEYEVPYPIALGGDGAAEAFGGAFALPTSFLLNPEGEIIGRFPGVFPADAMAEEFEQLLPPA
jgi:peroxiredoxin